jgi:glucose/arabinose dehydrogenase
VAFPASVGRSFLLADQSGIVTRRPRTDASSAPPRQRAVTYRAGNERAARRGLDPAFSSNRYVYIYASRGNPRRTILARYAVTLSDVADPASELLLLSVEQPFPNHKGGAIRFGPDGLLYLGLGDGGSGGDPGNRAQNLQELLGKILRLDVRGATPAQPYRAAGDPGLQARGARPELWAYGLRNPWRMSSDRRPGAIRGDVSRTA